MSTALLEVSQVRKNYGPIEVLRGVSLAVEPGQVFAIIGPNGAGKTTMFRVMTGEVACNGGSIRFKGEDVTRLSSHERVRRGFGRTFQVARVFADFDVLDNVVVAIEARRRHTGEPLGAWRRCAPSPDIRDEAMALLADLRLAGHAQQGARFLSHGDKKRLEFAIALAGRPAILMLDEPTAGMSPSDRADVAALIARMRRERGITVVMTEHDMDVVFGLADRIMVMNYGEVVSTGSVEAVRADPRVREVYLGKEMVHA
ncbi:branched-chain amino acid transport system ATP-binding protein [Pseudacidovorax intermedius]|uniref:Branched-chain amino acid transport system ATP-binding protein n=1 Tax=Pseudacidovorax intermedius TaxID=433924 RepID=A0A370FES3_9BURK|nr:ABC transporter ATP-binding protein [Pseudacidovorax intermedius]RDI22605.1 branched-chain amino acid transport system ATP-binding protein [Pseudacidovorax intermedius]